MYGAHYGIHRLSIAVVPRSFQILDPTSLVFLHRINNIVVSLIAVVNFVRAWPFLPGLWALAPRRALGERAKLGQTRLVFG